MADYIVFSVEDWNRIQKSAGLRQPEKSPQEQMRDRRKRLHEKSKADVATWTNTIEGQRLARLKAREEREKLKEAEAVKRDLEYAKLEAEERKKAIQEAKIKIIKQTDVMKNFERAQLLTEVLNERNSQGNFHETRRAFREEQDRARMESMMEDIRLAEEKELEKQKKAREAAFEVATDHLEKAAAKRAALRAERNSLLEERNRIAADEQAYWDAERAKEEKRRQEALELVKERERLQEKRNAIMKQRELMETVTYEKAELARQAKEKLDTRRKQDEIDMRQAEIKKRETIAASLLEIQESTEKDEERRKKVEEERWQKKEQEEAEKLARRKAAAEEINKYRESVMQRKQQMTQEELEADRKERQMVEEDFKKGFEFEAQKQATARKRNQELLESHADAIKRHEQAVAEERKKLQMEKEATLAALKKEKEILKRIAAHEIEKATQNGQKDIYPLQQAISKFEDPKPKQRPFQPSIDVRRRGNPYPNDSKRRLGFTWD